MSNDAKRQYHKAIRLRYKNSSKKEKTKMLDEFCTICGYNRKYAIRLLNEDITKSKRKRGRKPVYGLEVVKYLKELWLAMDQMCAVRLKAALPLWLPSYEAPEEIKKALLKISPATIDRRLKPSKVKHGRCGTKPGSLLKSQIPVQTVNWDITKPGFLEADTVAHCGNSLAGNFIWSLTTTDIYSGWTECRAVWNKGARGVKRQIMNIKNRLPFALLGFDCDNGSEFLNNQLKCFFQHKRIKFTRSRPYHINDNAHVEQKNWSHVRQLFGYERFDWEPLVDLMNDFYKNEWCLCQNYFSPNLKLLRKTRIGAKIKKEYEKPKTPCQRLLECNDISEEEKINLRATLASLNPFELNQIREKKLKKIFDILKLHKLPIAA